ncbi:hypothetical protein RKD41_000180 [Streptomyces tendae]
MFAGELDPAARVATAADGLDGADGGVEQVEEVRAEIEQRAVFQSPAGGELAAQEGTVKVAGPGAGDLPGAGGLQEGVGGRVVALGQHELGDDAGGSDGVGDAFGRGEVGTEGLLQEQGLSPAGRPGGQFGLDGGWYGEGDRLAPVEEFVEGGGDPGAVGCRGLVRGRGATGPYGGQAGLGPGCEHAGVHGARPWSRADEADLDGRVGEGAGNGGHGGGPVCARARGQARPVELGGWPTPVTDIARLTG